VSPLLREKNEAAFIADSAVRIEASYDPSLPRAVAPLAATVETCSYPCAMTRMVKCAKLGETLPGLPYKPFNDALGQRIYDSVSAEAWRQWIEHSKKIVNEYRLDLTQKKAHDVLKEQCEAFLFGDGGQLPPEYVPEKH
jgi:Fe-S cluster biosynthesis and repair protein YggX